MQHLQNEKAVFVFGYIRRWVVQFFNTDEIEIK